MSAPSQPTRPLRSRRLARLVAAVAIALAPATAAADAAEEAEAREAMQRGIALFGKGDAEGAIREYERAMQLVPTANVPYRYSAEAKASLGRLREAIADLEAYLAKNPQVSDAAAVRARIAELEARATRGELALSATVDGATARVDDAPAVALPVDLALAAGEHVVVVEKGGYFTVRQSVTIVSGKRDRLVVAISPRPAPPPPAPRAAAPASPWPTVGLAGVAVGGAALAVGGILDVTALGDRFDAVDRAANSGDPRLTEIQDDARTLRTVVQITYGAGLAVVIAGAALYLATRGARGGAPSPASTWSRAPLALPF